MVAAGQPLRAQRGGWRQDLRGHDHRAHGRQARQARGAQAAHGRGHEADRGRDRPDGRRVGGGGQEHVRRHPRRVQEARPEDHRPGDLQRRSQARRGLQRGERHRPLRAQLRRPEVHRRGARREEVEARKARRRGLRADPQRLGVAGSPLGVLQPLHGDLAVTSCHQVQPGQDGRTSFFYFLYKAREMKNLFHFRVYMKNTLVFFISPSYFLKHCPK